MFLNNYEVIKLGISHPEQTNTAIIAVLVCFGLLTARRSSLDKHSTGLLNRSETTQLRGLAILLVILGHLWVHVAEQKALFIFSGEAVAMFLLLSGFGLAMSVKKHKPTFQTFLHGRLQRIFIPYWFVTVFIIILDHFLLDRCYSPEDLFLTGIGLNSSESTRHIDYARWYITFQLFWYILFWIAISFLSQKRRDPFFFSCALTTFVLDYYFLHLGWYQFFAFPTGYYLAQHIEKLDEISHGNHIILAGTVFLCFSILFKSQTHFLEKYLPSIGLKMAYEAESILFCFGLMAYIHFFNRIKITSYFLYIAGTISYELYLLHGPFLIKYNPVIRHTYQPRFILEFILLLFLLLCISAGFHFIFKNKCSRKQLSEQLYGFFKKK